MQAIKITFKFHSILLIVFFLVKPGVSSADSLPENSNETKWTRYFEDCRMNPAFAGLNGHHVLTGSGQYSNEWFTGRDLYSLTYQNRIRKSGSGYRIDLISRRTGAIRNRELHASFSHSIPLHPEKNRLISAGIDLYYFRDLWVSPDSLSPKLGVLGLPAVNAGILFISGRFHAGIKMNNLRTIYRTSEEWNGTFYRKIPIDVALYGGYRTLSGISGTVYFNWLPGIGLPNKLFKKVGIYFPVKKVLLLGLKYSSLPFSGSALNFQATYISKKRLRAELILGGWPHGSKGIEANLSYVLGKQD